jgi:hypothetical protein
MTPHLLLVSFSSFGALELVRRVRTQDVDRHGCLVVSSDNFAGVARRALRDSVEARLIPAEVAP